MTRKRIWRYVRGLAAPVLLWVLFVAVLAQLLPSWLRGDQEYDEKALREWIDEARVFRDPLPDMVGDYLARVRLARANDPEASPESDLRLRLGMERIEEHLRALGNPPTKMYAGQLLLFPTIYRLEVNFDPGLNLPPIAWDSDLPRHPSQFRELKDHRLHDQADLLVQYQLHAFNKRQRLEQVAALRLRWVTALALAGTFLALAWVFLVRKRERARERQRLETQRQMDQLKSQLYASIGIMAGSYAHNIKNLLVRPNDLLRRCLEPNGLSDEQAQMLHEVRQTLGTVTERLQQILRTVQRDPSRSELIPLDLNSVIRDLHHTWAELARERWKLDLVLELNPEPLWIAGDPSHLQQAAENLLFNARDATFEMRNQLRTQARGLDDPDPAARRQALIDAASWRGRVVVRTGRADRRAVLAVQDNGLGMTEEVRRRCTETHFSTKRDNAIYEGQSTGLGLGLSFVVAILEHHHASLEIESKLLQGATFLARFPLMEPGPK
jgi:signal transduction histidine kinase